MAVVNFAQQLSNHEREFFLRMDEHVKFEDVVVRCKENSVSYFPDTKLKLQPLVLRYSISNSKLIVEMKLNFVDCYTDLINKMPENIKDMFRSIRHCPHKICDKPLLWRKSAPKCGTRRTYTLDGNHYYLCSYKYYFTPDITNPEDAEYYAKIVNAEVQVAKVLPRKKHNTTHHDEQKEPQEHKVKKEPLTEDTVIGSRKIPATEFRKFFKKMLGEDYEKYPIVRNVIKVSILHKGKTLKEIMDECLNPSEEKLPDYMDLL